MIITLWAAAVFAAVLLAHIQCNEQQQMFAQVRLPCCSRFRLHGITPFADIHFLQICILWLPFSLSVIKYVNPCIYIETATSKKTAWINAGRLSAVM